MGQYYIVANIDKEEFLHPHKFGSGMKLMEFSSDGQSVMQAVAVLLASGNNRGGGDLRSDDPIIGSWAGDRLVVAGDYADKMAHIPQEEQNDDSIENLYEYAQGKGNFEDISDKVIRVIVEAEGQMSRMFKLDTECEGWRDTRTKPGNAEAN